MHSLTWQQALTGLLERMQTYQDAESRQVLAAWMKERQELRCITKALFNAQFGSIFRTFHNPTYFSRRLVRFSDLYMASSAACSTTAWTSPSTPAARPCSTRHHSGWTSSARAA